MSHIVLVHYREVKGNRINFSRIREPQQVTPDFQEIDEDVRNSEVDSSASTKFYPNNYQVNSQVTDRNSLSSVQESKRNNSSRSDVGYVELETIDPSMKMGNMLPGSEGSAEISQDVDNQNYKEGGTFENSNLAAKIMEIRSPFKERKDNESVDLGSSTMSSKGIILEEQSVESYVNCYSWEC